MKYQTRKVKHLTDLQLLTQLRLGAKIYSKYAESALLFIFSGGKNKPYEAYEVFAHKYNFMHLGGVKSQTLGAAEFYQACLEGKIKREDCSPVHSVSNMYSKVSVLNQLLDLKNSKCYKIGEKTYCRKNIICYQNKSDSILIQLIEYRKKKKFLVQRQDNALCYSLSRGTSCSRHLLQR